MTVCPNCNYNNPDDAVQCEACYTSLPTATAQASAQSSTCPSCSAPVHAGAKFCGQCGIDLTKALAQPLAASSPPSHGDKPIAAAPVPGAMAENATAAVVSPPASDAPHLAVANVTKLQINRAQFLHLQTDTLIELPPHLEMVHIGKSNNRIPPDIDVSGFPDAEIVSRVHAHVRIEGEAYYLEDAGSSNGTYVNNLPLPYGNRHRLRRGDRVALGKGDKVTFIFQQS